MNNTEAHRGRRAGSSWSPRSRCRRRPARWRQTYFRCLPCRILRGWTASPASSCGHGCLQGREGAQRESKVNKAYFMSLIFPLILHCVRSQCSERVEEQRNRRMRAAALPRSYMSALQNELQVIHAAGDVSVTRDPAAGIWSDASWWLKQIKMAACRGEHPCPSKWGLARRHQMKPAPKSVAFLPPSICP